MFQRNASKFAIFCIYENPKLLFPFFISCYFIFLPNECPGLWQHRPGNSLGNEKRKKQLWVFVYIKYGKFWSISLELFVEHKPLIYEECLYYFFQFQVHCVIRNYFCFIIITRRVTFWTISSWFFGGGVRSDGWITLKKFTQGGPGQQWMGENQSRKE